MKSELRNYEDAFRSAHTLKGVCQNLSFDRLYEVSHELTELLRDGTGEQPGIPEAMEKVTEVYEINEEFMKQKLYEFRGCKVLLDADLAEVYGTVCWRNI